MDNLEESLSAIQKIREEMPEVANAYLNFTEKAKSTEFIDQKNKSLILLSMSILSKCEMCIIFNTEAALNEGATKEEILETTMLAVSMGGGPIMMYVKYVMQIFED